uniref:Myb/SANT-like DNA-binding domain-containing protein n=1 Tax=Knipowitschia caucasica TaxID=637954 RepID=A0AAV2L2D8_KNICA
METPLVALNQFSENSYKMTEDDVKRLIEIRASNEALFTGKRNSAKLAWSTILKGLGLEGKLTPDQISKKWDNLRSKYKDLKQPYQGQELSGGLESSWPWFHMMEEAMHGRLFNSSLVLHPDPEVEQGEEPSEEQSQPQPQENQDILEFLIKTEMDESVEMRRTRSSVGTTAAPVPLGWRRMSECSYRWTDNETEKLIKLRAANEVLFTGKRNTAKPAWRAILFEMGLQGKVSIDQLAKKWDNLKRKYKELKFPAPGVDPNLSSWPWFFRMTEAMEGRLAGAAPILTPIVEEEDDYCEASSPIPKKRLRRSRGMTDFLTESEIDLLVENVEKNGAGNLDSHRGEYSYRLTEEDTRRLIELRAANEVLFTGKRNTVRPAWRAVVKELGLAGKITPDQVAKKWDNLKTRFKDLKFPPQGMEGQVNPSAWPWFKLMSDALEGRLMGKAPTVEPVWSDADVFLASPSPPPPVRDCPLEDRRAVQALESSLVSEEEGSEDVALIDANGEEASGTNHGFILSDELTGKFIKLRAANESLFTGRRNAAKAAWRAILVQLGLQGKVSTVQLAKKWDNLKRRYKDLRFPPVGMEASVDPSSWPWYSLMHDAIEGRLSHCAPLLEPDETPDETPSKPKRQPPAPANPPHITPSNTSASTTAPDFSTETFVTESNVALHREWGVLDRERAALQRERQMLEQERATVQAERMWLEREREDLQRDRAIVEAERAALARDREVLDQRAIMLNTVGHVQHLNSLM